ncbi:MAG: hypothetical protein B7Z37_25600 [Verrucomicrobia bacterium 12-59-8]|nr:MAG: hypothetical protein B7Z37_25600 [Verrucomicrobia bacterium 12-59-8]
MANATDKLQTQDIVRRVLANEQSSISVCWYASLLVSDIQLPTSDDDPDYDFDPEFYLSELEREISQTVDDFTRGKILLAATAVFTDLIFNSLPSFIEFANMCNATNPPLPGVFNPANATECSLALFDLSLITTDLTPRGVSALMQQSFTEEIRTYWAAVLSSEGAIGPVPPLITAIFPTPDPLGDPAFFEAMAGQTDQYAKSLKQAMYDYAHETFEQLVKLHTREGKPCITAREMQGVFDTLTGATT